MDADHRFERIGNRRTGEGQKGEFGSAYLVRYLLEIVDFPSKELIHGNKIVDGVTSIELHMGKKKSSRFARGDEVLKRLERQYPSAFPQNPGRQLARAHGTEHAAHRSFSKNSPKSPRELLCSHTHQEGQEPYACPCHDSLFRSTTVHAGTHRCGSEFKYPCPWKESPLYLFFFFSAVECECSPLFCACPCGVSSFDCSVRVHTQPRPFFLLLFSLGRMRNIDREVVPPGGSRYCACKLGPWIIS